MCERKFSAGDIVTVLHYDLQGDAITITGPVRFIGEWAPGAEPYVFCVPLNDRNTHLVYHYKKEAVNG